MPLSSRRRKRVDLQHHDIPTKANRVLRFILIAMLLVLVRIWHLSVIQYDQKLEESQKPQRKSVIVPAVRGTIRDRFNLPLAINKISYQATIFYSQLRDIPSIVWKTDESGKRVRHFKRKEYIHQLSEVLARELSMDAQRVEDLIHAKASYYSQVPFVIKDDLNEREYYRLKMLENDWPGLHVRHLPKRHYPLGKVAADIVGYMGAINRGEYERVLHEMKAIEQFIYDRENDEDVEEISGIHEIEQARNRLEELRAKAYTIHDYVGKTGVEAVCEEQLRGIYGKKKFYADSKGNYLQELPGSKPSVPGQRILLSISSELQEYAEQLLAQNEDLRIIRKSRLGPVKKTVIAEKHPWIKGGSIVVMDPFNGEILTLASYPRFDPNDFILSGDRREQQEKKMNIHQCFENETYLARVWNQQQPLTRERYDEKNKQFYNEEKFLTWSAYLNTVLPLQGELKQAMNQIKTIQQAIEIQRAIEELMTLCSKFDLYAIFNQLYCDEMHEPHRQVLKGEEKQELSAIIKMHQAEIELLKEKLNRYLGSVHHNYDKVLIVDFCRLAVDSHRFSDILLSEMGNVSLEDYHGQEGGLVALLEQVREVAKSLYHETDFKRWRKSEEAAFLKSKRIEEKSLKTYPKPYIDYLDVQENQLFSKFWTAHRWDFLYAFLLGEWEKSRLEASNLFEESSDSALDPTFYLNAFLAQCHKMKSQIISSKSNKAYLCLRSTINEISKDVFIEYLKSMRMFEELNRPLLGRYRLCAGKRNLEKHLAMAFYPIYGYGYGRSHGYRQATIQGSIFKLVTGYEALVQRFHKMGKRVLSPQDLNPLIITDDVYFRGNTQCVGYTEDGQPIAQLYKGGRLPRSLAHQHIGKVDIVKAMEMSSNPYFSLLAGECMESPSDLSKAARLFGYGSLTEIDLNGEIAGNVPDDLAKNRTGLYAMAIGQHTLVVTPLQTAVMMAAIANGGKVLKPKIIKLTAECNLINGCPSKNFHAQLPRSISKSGSVREVPTEVLREIFMPEIVRQILLRSLRAVSERTHKESLTSLTRLYKKCPEAIRTLTALKEQILGKTSTSESVENIDLDLKEGINLYTHVWYGSIVFENNQQDKNKMSLLLKDEFGQPELIVVVYLRYGAYGKDAVPLAAQIVKKWREIKQRHAANTISRK